MTKVFSKRKSVIYKRQLAKRNWLLHRPRNTAKKLKKNFGKTKVYVAQEEGPSGNRFTQTIGLLTRRARSCIHPISTIEFLTRKVESCVYTIALLLSYSSSLPVRLFRTCMSLGYFGFCKSLAVAREGRERLHTSLFLSMYNGYSHFKRAVSFVGDVIFPSRPYKRKLDEMCDRLEEVENELKKLKREAELNKQTSSSNVSSNILSVVAMPSLTCLIPSAPPPPPPPPPPPICKPPEPITFKKTNKVDKNEKKEARKVSVTLEDLKSVKLRKVILEEDDDDEEDKENLSSPLTFGLRKSSSARCLKKKQSSSHPFITLKDIKKVSLRKTETISAKKSRSPGHCKLAFLKTKLRKVHVRRSPGGTPFTEKSKESYGEGLTPIMTRALQRKFKFANPPSPVDSFHETSNFFEKTLSRTNPPSPLARSSLRSPLTSSSLGSPLNRSSRRPPFAHSSPRSPFTRSSPRSPLTRSSPRCHLNPSPLTRHSPRSSLPRPNPRSPLTNISSLR